MRLVCDLWIRHTPGRPDPATVREWQTGHRARDMPPGWNGWTPDYWWTWPTLSPIRYRTRPYRGDRGGAGEWNHYTRKCFSESRRLFREYSKVEKIEYKS